jgi:hypothetical protein
MSYAITMTHLNKLLHPFITIVNHNIFKHFIFIDDFIFQKLGSGESVMLFNRSRLKPFGIMVNGHKHILVSISGFR